MKIPRILVGILMSFWFFQAQTPLDALDPRYERNGEVYLLIGSGSEQGVYRLNDPANESVVVGKLYDPGLSRNLGVDLQRNLYSFLVVDSTTGTVATTIDRAVMDASRGTVINGNNIWYGYHYWFHANHDGVQNGVYGPAGPTSGTNAAKYYDTAAIVAQSGNSLAFTGNLVSTPADPLYADPNGRGTPNLTGYKIYRIKNNYHYRTWVPSTWQYETGYANRMANIYPPFWVFRDNVTLFEKRFELKKWNFSTQEGNPVEGVGSLATISTTSSYRENVNRHVLNACLDGCGTSANNLVFPAKPKVTWVTMSTSKTPSGGNTVITNYLYDRTEGSTDGVVKMDGNNYNGTSIGYLNEIGVSPNYLEGTRWIGASLKNQSAASPDYIYLLSAKLINNWLNTSGNIPAAVSVSQQWNSQGGLIFSYIKAAGIIYKFIRNEASDTPTGAMNGNQIEIISNVGTDVDDVKSDGFGNVYFAKTSFDPPEINGQPQFTAAHLDPNFNSSQRHDKSGADSDGKVNNTSVLLKFRQNVYKTVYKLDVGQTDAANATAVGNKYLGYQEWEQYWKLWNSDNDPSVSFSPAYNFNAAPGISFTSGNAYTLPNLTNLTPVPPAGGFPDCRYFLAQLALSKEAVSKNGSYTLYLDPAKLINAMSNTPFLVSPGSGFSQATHLNALFGLGATDSINAHSPASPMDKIPSPFGVMRLNMSKDTPAVKLTTINLTAAAGNVELQVINVPTPPEVIAFKAIDWQSTSQATVQGKNQWDIEPNGVDDKAHLDVEGPYFIDGSNIKHWDNHATANANTIPEGEIVLFCPENFAAYRTSDNAFVSNNPRTLSRGSLVHFTGTLPNADVNGNGFVGGYCSTAIDSSISYNWKIVKIKDENGAAINQTVVNYNSSGYVKGFDSPFIAFSGTKGRYRVYLKSSFSYYNYDNMPYGSTFGQRVNYVSTFSAVSIGGGTEASSEFEYVGPAIPVVSNQIKLAQVLGGNAKSSVQQGGSEASWILTEATTRNLATGLNASNIWLHNLLDTDSPKYAVDRTDQTSRENEDRLYLFHSTGGDNVVGNNEFLSQVLGWSTSELVSQGMLKSGLTPAPPTGLSRVEYVDQSFQWVSVSGNNSNPLYHLTYKLPLPAITGETLKSYPTDVFNSGVSPSGNVAGFQVIPSNPIIPTDPSVGFLELEISRYYKFQIRVYRYYQEVVNGFPVLKDAPFAVYEVGPFNKNTLFKGSTFTFVKDVTLPTVTVAPKPDTTHNPKWWSNNLPMFGGATGKSLSDMGAGLDLGRGTQLDFTVADNNPWYGNYSTTAGLPRTYKDYSGAVLSGGFSPRNINVTTRFPFDKDLETGIFAGVQNRSYPSASSTFTSQNSIYGWNFDGGKAPGYTAQNLTGPAVNGAYEGKFRFTYDVTKHTTQFPVDYANNLQGYTDPAISVGVTDGSGNPAGAAAGAIRIVDQITPYVEVTLDNQRWATTGGVDHTLTLPSNTYYGQSSPDFIWFPEGNWSVTSNDMRLPNPTQIGTGNQNRPKANMGQDIVFFPANFPSDRGAAQGVFNSLNGLFGGTNRTLPFEEGVRLNLSFTARDNIPDATGGYTNMFTSIKQVEVDFVPTPDALGGNFETKNPATPQQVPEVNGNKKFMVDGQTRRIQNFNPAGGTNVTVAQNPKNISLVFREAGTYLVRVRVSDTAKGFESADMNLASDQKRTRLIEFAIPVKPALFDVRVLETQTRPTN